MYFYKISYKPKQHTPNHTLNTKPNIFKLKHYIITFKFKLQTLNYTLRSYNPSDIHKY